MKKKGAHYLIGTHRTDHTADLSVLFRLQVNSLALVVPAKIKNKKKMETHETISCPKTEKTNSNKIDKARILQAFG